MRPYSLDLRERIAAAIDDHEGSIREIARVFRVSTSFIVRLLQRRRASGTLDPEPHGGGTPPALGSDDLDRLAALVREQPDATLGQLKQRGGFRCSLKTLWLALDRGWPGELVVRGRAATRGLRARPDSGKLAG
jgi:transposase